MRVTIILGAFFPVPPIMGGAVEKVMFALGQELARRGHEVVMVSRTMPQFPTEEIRDGIRHIRVRGFNAPRSLPWLKFLDLIYSMKTMSILPKADIVITNTFWLPLLLNATKHGLIYVHVTRYPKGQMRFYWKAARLQAPSRAVARAIAAEAPRLASKVLVIPNPVPRPAPLPEPPPVEQRENVILYVGRVHPEKGVHLLVDAFAASARTLFADWRLVILGPAEDKFGGGGDKYLTDLKRRTATAQANIVFPGAVFDQNALQDSYRSARIFVYPSMAEYGEAFGVAPLEAMSNRAAVIVSNLDCFHDFITDNETGFIFDHRAKDPADKLREKMSQVILNPTLLSSVAEAGYQKSASYSPSQVTDLFLNDFNLLLGNSDDARTSR
ncbi:MAG: glycosyltransferase family 4 protein [Verrucomicrobiota bacterium]